MAYPILPIVLTWNTPYSYQARVNSSRNQDGVKRRERLGINLITEEIDGAVVIRNYPEVDAFLRERRGRPFRLPAENRFLGDEDKLYICREWSGPQLGPGLYRFSGKFEQVRVLKNPIFPAPPADVILSGGSLMGGPATVTFAPIGSITLRGGDRSGGISIASLVDVVLSGGDRAGGRTSGVLRIEAVGGDKSGGSITASNVRLSAIGGDRSGGFIESSSLPDQIEIGGDLSGGSVSATTPSYLLMGGDRSGGDSIPGQTYLSISGGDLSGGSISATVPSYLLMGGDRSGGFLSTAVGLHPDTANYRDRVIAQGGTIDPSILTALNDFVIGVYADGLRDATPIVRDVWLPVCANGSPMAAVRQKLWWINSDTLANTSNPITSYTLTGGVTGDGLGAFLTGVIPTVDLSATTGHFALYNRTDGNSLGGHGSIVLSGSFPAVNFYEKYTNGQLYFYWTDSGLLNFSIGTATGLLLGTYDCTDGNSANWRQVVYRNGSQIGIRTPPTVGTQPNVEIAVFGIRTQSGSIVDNSARQIGGYSLGRAMSSSQASAYYNRWQTLMTAIGRNV